MTGLTAGPAAGVVGSRLRAFGVRLLNLFRRERLERELWVLETKTMDRHLALMSLPQRTFVGVPLVLAAAALVAAYLPARRASRVHPVTALRTD